MAKYTEQSLEKGKDMEMEHVETIKKYMKKGVDIKEVAESIAKDHLEENPEYYKQLEKMESERESEQGSLEFKGGGDINCGCSLRCDLHVKVKVEYLEKQTFQSEKELFITKSEFKKYQKTGKVPKWLEHEMTSFTGEEHWIETTPLSIHLTKVEDSFKDGGLLHGLSEEAVMYIDIISNYDGKGELAEKYKKILKEKTGIDYDKYYGKNDDNLIQNADVNNIKRKEDFLNYDNWIKYSYEILRKRGFDKNQPKYIEGVLTFDEIKQFCDNFNIQFEIMPEYKGYGNYAEHSLGIVRVPIGVDINTFIHEIGHYYDWKTKYEGVAKNPAYATSFYWLRNAGEVYAENFKYYFIANEWLKNNMPIVYEELDKTISTEYKEKIFELINSLNNFKKGGEILLAPNGKPSNLTPEQYKLVRTPAFKKWFGDWENDPKNSSKVIDEETKEPLVVFHGTDNEFAIFDTKKSNFGQFGEGSYFTNIRDEYKGKFRYEVFLNLKNPFLFDAKNKNTSYEDIVEIFSRNLDFGAIIKNPRNVKQYELGIRNYYIVFEPNQIKLADGSNTTFDGSNPDIRFDYGGRIINYGCLINKNDLVFEYGEKDNGDWFDIILRTPSLNLIGVIEVGKISKDNWKILNVDIKDNCQGLGYGKLLYEKVFDKLSKSKGQIIYSDTTINSPFVHKIWEKYPAEKLNIGIDWKGENKFQYKLKLDDIKNPDIRFDEGGNVLLAPNGKPSNLTPEQYKLVRTKAFKDWFGDWEKLALTKINDSGIDEISMNRLEDGVSKVVDDNGEPMVVYHGSNIDFNVFEKSKTNPYAEKQGYFFALDKKYAESYNSKYVKPFFINIRIKGTFDDDDNLVPFNADGNIVQGLQVEVYDKKNIKLADGSNTTFDGSNPDIRFKDGGEIELKLDEEYKKLMNDENNFPFNILNEKSEIIGRIELIYREDLGGYQIYNSKVKEKGKGIGKKAYIKLRQILGKPIISDSSRTEDAENLWKSLEKNNLAFFDENTLKYKMYKKGGRTIAQFEGLTAEKMLENPLTIKYLKDLDNGEGWWVDTFHAKTKNYLPNTYYHLNTSGNNAGVGKGLYLGRDKNALISFYGIQDGIENDFDTHLLDTYIGNPNWLDLINYDDYEKIKKEALDKYEFNINLKGLEQLDEVGELMKKIAIEKGYDGIRYYDPNATGEEFVLFNTEKLKKIPNTYKKGGRTIAQTPAPKKERIYGSEKNKPESSKDTKSAEKIEFNEKTLETIKNKVDEHNENNPNKKITLASAKAVVRRGMGAYSSSHRPTISGGKPNNRVAWGLARLNAFIYKIINNKSKSGKYNQDDDLINELGYKVNEFAKGGKIPTYSHLNLDDWHTQKIDNQINIHAKEYFEKNITDDYWHFSTLYMTPTEVTYEIYSEKGGYYLHFTHEKGINFGKKNLQKIDNQFNNGGQTDAQQKKIAKVMHEFKEGDLTSQGKEVTNPKQAIAIALSEAGVERKKDGGNVYSVKSNQGNIKLNLEEHHYNSDTDTELVPVSELIKMREFDRTEQPKFNVNDSKSNIEFLKNNFKTDGIKEPLMIEYSSLQKSVLLTEGNHRLNSAIELGIEYLPARVVVNKYTKFKDKQSKKMLSVSGFEPNEHGYIPSLLKPSDVGIQGTKPIRFEEGGVIEGQLHSECNESHGCGEKFEVGENGRIIEAERDEAVIVSKAFESDKEYIIEGNPSEIASALNVIGDGKNFDKGAVVKDENGVELDLPKLENEAKDKDVDYTLEGGTVIINRKSMADEKEYVVKGTAKQIASAINSLDGNGVVIEEGAEIEKLKDGVKIDKK